MKNWKSCLFVLTGIATSLVADAAITIPGADGSDGTLLVTNNVTIDLSLAVTDDWNTAGTGAGVYDSNKWAVVFKYSNVVVSNGCTVNFVNHASRAPVVWLVSGDVTIDGTVSLAGQSFFDSPPNLAEPGPGGFRGGMETYTGGINASAGFGPGGGFTEVTDSGRGASHLTAVTSSPAPYGNESIVPLIGGSGGGGGNYYSGGAGGGAILIACGGSMTVDGMIAADGGAGRQDNYNDAYRSGGGSGGAIRLIAESFGGSGFVYARGGGGNYSGSNGRVRLERVNNSGTVSVVPDPSILGLQGGATALIWPPAGAPEARIVSVGGVSVSSDPRAEFGTTLADAAIPQTNSTYIVVETVNVESASQVIVRVTPRHSASFSEYTATLTATNNLSPLTLEWTAVPPVNLGYSAVQVRVVRP